jgi:hypothetical protein
MRLLFFFGFLILSFNVIAQRTIKDRVIDADLIVEGQVIEQHSFWDDKKDNIYTVNTIRVSKYFKGGQSLDDLIEVITRGGTVEDVSQLFTHNLQLQVGQEGVFLCKSYYRQDIRSSSFFVVNGTDSFIKYANPITSAVIIDNAQFYTNLEAFYSDIIAATGEPFVALYPNRLEEQLNTLVSENFSIVSESDNIIFFSFENVQITSGNKLEFDIYVMSNVNGIRFAASEVVLTYNQQAFGAFVVANEKIEAEKRTVIQNQTYTLALTDESASVVKFVTNSGIEVNQLYSLTTTPEEFCHVKIDIDDINQLANLTFDDFAMSDQSLFYDPATGEYIGFDKVGVDGTISSLLLPSISSFSPSSLRAGTGDILTISGNMFGTSPGTVRFANADDGGQTMMEAQPSDIISWSNTDIEIQVPSNQLTTITPAGTGIIEIETTNGDIASTLLLSNPTVEIRFAFFNFRNASGDAVPVHLADAIEGDGNEDGKLVFTRNLSVPSEGIPIIEQAFCDWNSASGTNWGLESSPSFSSTSSDTDGKNLIYFAPSSEFFTNPQASAFTKITTSRLVSCQNTSGGSPIAYRNQVDIIFRENLLDLTPAVLGGWHYNTFSNPSPNQLDFYSHILHELGHAHMLKHTIPDNTVMWYMLAQGVARRNIDANNSEGASYVLDESEQQLNSSFTCPQEVTIVVCPPIIRTFYRPVIE